MVQQNRVAVHTAKMDTLVSESNVVVPWVWYYKAQWWFPSDSVDTTVVHR
jgi:hypothetical protein